MPFPACLRSAWPFSPFPCCLHCFFSQPHYLILSLLLNRLLFFSWKNLPAERSSPEFNCTPLGRWPKPPTGDGRATLLEVTVNNESNDPHWKELADYLRKLNVDFYWRAQNMISEKKANNILPPSRPMRRAGMGISMTMRQDHTPPDLLGVEESAPSQKSENRDRKRNSPERWLR